ncbi:Unknown protein, partial [Striga hermonthica]
VGNSNAELQARVQGKKPIVLRGHPFAEDVLGEDLPSNFRELSLSYDGSADPARHLRSFNNIAVLHRYSDAVSCRAFLTTLKGSAQDWFHQLPAGSIDGIEKSFDELLERCSKYMNMEESEADSIRNDKTKAKQVEERPRQGDRRAALKEARVEDRFRGLRYEHYQSLNAPQHEILETMEKRGEDKLLAQPKPLPPPRKFSASKDRSCRYQRDYGHSTNFCRELKDEIGQLIRADHLKEFVIKDKERQDDRREGSSDKRRRTDEQPDRPVKKGIIHMITGGPTDGDSHRERKRTSRGKGVAGKVAEVQVQKSSATLKFGADDVQGLVVPHNDALVITAEVASYDVQRVLIDTGSSADIIFLKCLQQMELDIKVEPVHTALYGFSGSEVRP